MYEYMGIIKVKRIVDNFKNSSVIRFLVSGGCSTGIDLLIYMLLSCRLDIAISKGCSMLISSLFSYVLNKRFTFKNKDKISISQMIRYYVVFVINFTVNLSVNSLVHSICGWKLIAFCIATLCGMTVNYIGQRYWVYK